MSATRPPGVNPAVRAHLQRIVEDERGRTVRWVSWLRLAGASLYLASLQLHAAPGSGAVSLLFVAYVALALVVVLAPPGRSSLLWSAYLPGALDLPMMSLAAWLAANSFLPALSVVGSWLPFVTVVVLASTLTMGHGAIAVTTVSALLCGAALLSSFGESPVVPMLVLSCTGALAATLVSRLRALVEESRRKDFAGRYVLGRRIGVGAVAEVFEATYAPERSFERRVAVKRLLPHHSSNERIVALFRREASIGAQLAHPNLLHVFDFGRYFDAWFIAMEYVDGLSLAALLRAQRQPLPVAAGLFIIAEVAEALAYLHDRPSADGAVGAIVHRDVNPPNVLLSARGEVKLGDFGVARRAGRSELAHAGARPGKSAYLPPEQVVGPRVDLFALGVTGWESLAGRRLFDGRTEQEQRQRAATLEVPPICSVRPGVPDSVGALLAGLLERDTARPSPTAREVVSALRVLGGAEAPYPHGRAALARAVAEVRVLLPPP